MVLAERCHGLEATRRPVPIRRHAAYPKRGQHLLQADIGWCPAEFDGRCRRGSAKSKQAFESEVPQWRKLFTDYYLPQDKYPSNQHHFNRRARRARAVGQRPRRSANPGCDAVIVKGAMSFTAFSSWSFLLSVISVRWAWHSPPPERTRISMEVHDISGLVVGSSVQLRGVPIGEVNSIATSPQKRRSTSTSIAASKFPSTATFAWKTCPLSVRLTSNWCRALRAGSISGRPAARYRGHNTAALDLGTGNNCRAGTQPV